MLFAGVEQARAASGRRTTDVVLSFVTRRPEPAEVEERLQQEVSARVAEVAAEHRRREVQQQAQWTAFWEELKRRRQQAEMRPSADPQEIRNAAQALAQHEAAPFQRRRLGMQQVALAERLRIGRELFSQPARAHASDVSLPASRAADTPQSRSNLPLRIRSLRSAYSAFTPSVFLPAEVILRR